MDADRATHHQEAKHVVTRNKQCINDYQTLTRSFTPLTRPLQRLLQHSPPPSLIAHLPREQLIPRAKDPAHDAQQHRSPAQAHASKFLAVGPHWHSARLIGLGAGPRARNFTPTSL
ncbi:hypothetical protein IG631_00509 [Alternaria alternata]|nr:hypothetical protein IG631_00509 [Alternaria alternata]